MVELIVEHDNRVRLWATDLHDITIVCRGHDDAVLVDERVRPMSKVWNNPKGKPRFKGIIIGLLVVRYMPGKDGAALFATEGGTVIEVQAEKGDQLPEDLPLLAEALGLCSWVRGDRPLSADGREAPAINWYLSSFIGKALDAYVEVAFRTDGTYTIKTDYPDKDVVIGHVKAYLNRWRAVKPMYSDLD
jgi:hypothetical protein